MKRFLFLLCLCVLPRHGVYAQAGASNLKTFGYFQAALGSQRDVNLEIEIKSFTLQQLNLFLQKDLARNWSAFVNFELVNSYSSLHNWGAFSLEEAWVNYHRSHQFKLKVGLLTPTFNNLNEIKNRMPLLPYIIRPVVYESSLSETIPTEHFVPVRAFVQAYGYVPSGATKFDYAIYLGNSSNINADKRRGVTGLDTTRIWLIGGRMGVRRGLFKTGLSATFDKLDLSATATQFNRPPEFFRRTPRSRLGADLSFTVKRLAFEAELIRVLYEFAEPQFDFDKQFYYGTLSYQLSERLLLYGSYWVAKENNLPILQQEYEVPTLGMTYNLNEAIVLKAQTALVHLDIKQLHRDENYSYSYLAISVMF